MRRFIQLTREAYYREFKDYFGSTAHGVALMGHPDQGDDIERERFFHIPGQDLVYRFVAPERGGLGGSDSDMAKYGAASPA